jgi:hypothetical protein
MLAATASDRLRIQVILLTGLGALSVGMVGLGFWPDRPALTGGLLVAGGGLLVWSFWEQGRRVRRSRYQRLIWAQADRVLLGVSLAALGIWLALLLSHGDWLLYYPYPPYSPWPTFEPALGVALLLLAAPALLLFPVDRRRP